MFLVPNLFIAQKIHLGIKGGVNFSSISGLDGIDTREGYHFGATASFMLTEKFWLQPEVTYSRQGYDVSSPVLVDIGLLEPSVNFKYSEKFHYLNVPVLINYEIINSLQIQFGPQAGFLLNNSEIFDFEQGELEDLNNSFSFLGNTTGVELGFALGAQYNILNFFIQARYIAGITDIFTGDNKTDNTITNRNFQVSMGYNFF